MCLLLFRYLYKRAKSPDGPQRPERSKEKKAPKEVELCEHQLAATKGAKSDGVLDDEKLPNSDTVQIDDEKSPNPTTEPIPDEKRGPKHCPECIAENKRARIYRWKLILSLLLPNMMASIDLTIVATALPTIASHFNKLTQFNWIVTAFTLASTSTILLFGQVADVFGRHTVIQASIFFILIGSTLGAGAQAWAMLLLGRAFQGLGFAGLGIVTKIILSDKVSLKENSANNTLFALLNGLSVGVGPVIGGYLTKASWRWCFIINVPIAVISHVTVFFLLRNELVKAQPHRREDEDGKITVIETPTLLAKLSIIDYGGVLLFFFGTGLLILGLTWGGVAYSWHSAAVLVSLIMGCILFISFFVYEYLMAPGRALSKVFPRQAPMIPLSLFRTRDIGLLTYLSFSTGMALYSVFYFVGIWFTVVRNYSSGKAGTQLTYYMPGLGVGAYTAMFLCNVWPRQTFFPLFFGSTLEPLGVGMLTWALNTGRPNVVCGMLGFAGVGTGLRMMPAMIHVVGMRSRFKARVLAVTSFAFGFGGTVGVSVMSAVFSNKLSGYIANAVHDISNSTSGVGNVPVTSNSTSSVQIIQDLPLNVQVIVRGWFSDAVYWAYVSILPFLALAGVLVFFIGNVQITSQKQDVDGDIDTSGNVEDVPFLWWLATRRRREAVTEAQAVE